MEHRSTPRRALPHGQTSANARRQFRRREAQDLPIVRKPRNLHHFLRLSGRASPISSPQPKRQRLGVRWERFNFGTEAKMGVLGLRDQVLGAACCGCRLSLLLLAPVPQFLRRYRRRISLVCVFCTTAPDKDEPSVPIFPLRVCGSVEQLQPKALSLRRQDDGGAMNLSHPHAPGFVRGFLFPATLEFPFRDFRTNPACFLVSFLPICFPCNAPAYRNCSQTPFECCLFPLWHLKG